MLSSPRWYVALDADQTGDSAASKFPERAVRVRPPDPFNDWTDLWRSGSDRVRHYWSLHLDGIYATDERRAIQSDGLK